MVSKFTLNSSVYMNIDLTKLSYGTQTHGFLATFTSARYRLDGGAWVYVYGADSIIFDVGFINELYQIIGGVPTNIISLPSTYKRLEIVGTLSNFTQDLDYSLPDVQIIQTGTIENPITITLYQLKCEPHVVNKGATNLLNPVGEIMGALREEINILAPSILIEYPKLPDFDYVYIPKLFRYYFVQSYNCVRNNIYRIELKVDVLYSFNYDIRKQNCYITRNENTTNNTLVDERRPLSDVPSISIYDTSDATYKTTNNCITCTIDQNNFSGYNFVVTTIVDNVPSGSITPPTYGSFLPTIAPYTAGKLPMALLRDDARIVQLSLIKDSTKSGFFESIIAYPFDVTTFTTNTGTPLVNFIFGDPVYYIDKDTLDFVQTTPTNPLKCKYLNSVSLGYAIISDFKIYAPTSGSQRYISFEPYTTMEMYIPFVGWVKLNCVDIWDSRIVVYYGIDVSSGFATAFVYNVDAQKLVYSSSCQIGVKLPLSTTNAEENERQKQNNVSNLTLGLISSGLSAGIGVATKNPLGVISGILSVANTIKSYSNANNLMFERGQVMFTSTETGFYTNQNKVLVKCTTHTPISVTESVYKELNGYPVNQYKVLTLVTGYTEISDMHYVPNTLTYITKNEIDEIISLARDGIIL